MLRAYSDAEILARTRAWDALDEHRSAISQIDVAWARADWNTAAQAAENAIHALIRANSAFTELAILSLKKDSADEQT